MRERLGLRDWITTILYAPTFRGADLKGAAAPELLDIAALYRAGIVFSSPANAAIACPPCCTAVHVRQHSGSRSIQPPAPAGETDRRNQLRPVHPLVDQVGDHRRVAAPSPDGLDDHGRLNSFLE